MKLFKFWDWIFPVHVYQTNVAAAVAGATVVGGAMASQATKSAGNSAAGAQVQAAQIGADEERRQFDAVQKLLSPFVNVATGGGGLTREQIRAELLPQFRVNDPNNPNGIDDIGLNAAVEQRLAQQAAGPKTGSLTAQLNLLGLNGADAQSQAIAGIDKSPMMAALLSQGENAILQNASATGGLRGGNTQGALAQFRPQLLNQLIDQQYARLGGLTSMSQNAAAGVGNAGLQTGNNISNLMQQAGAAQAGAALANGKADASMWNTLGSSVGMFAGLGGFGSF